ncbi:unnamed protein product, partial [Brassica oleracea]
RERGVRKKKRERRLGAVLDALANLGLLLFFFFLVRAVYKKYSKIENGGVALVSPTKSLLGSAAADSKKP